MSRDDLVVGIDNSAPSRAALGWAAHHARRNGMGLRAVHVLSWPLARDLYKTNPIVPDYVYPEPAQVEGRYRAACEQLFAAIVPEEGWTLQFGQGHAGRVLVAEATTAQLLVLGMREHTGLSRLVSGSTAHYCLNHATCPAVAVPARAVTEPALSPPDRVVSPTG
jgi:nucleotide-binding universal stress UspA family protein